MAALRAALLDWRKYLVGIFTQVLANPVIGRELRVRVRMGRGYLLQAAYLAFMILIVALAYEWAVGDETTLRNPVQVQEALIGFYYLVMSTLIALITLIAPALTANAITIERERKTIDLLIATPLTARHLLTGKLVASFAFIVLLLALTLPVSAVSVLLGGTSFADLLKAYLMVACSGLVLCSIALFTSVYARSSTVAVLWSYVRIGAFLSATGALTIAQGSLVAMGGRGGGGAGVDLIFPVALLNPFTATVAADTQVDFKHWQVPSWILSVVVCLLFTRLVLTAAARKVGLYDKDVMPSLRRQLLLLLPLHVMLTTIPILTFAPIPGGIGLGSVSTGLATVLIILCAGPIVLLAGWIAPFGKDEDKECPNDGVFRLSKMLTASPSGALPFLVVAWVLMLGAFLFSLYWTDTLWAFDISFWEFTLGMAMYLTGLWVLFWGIGRFCSVLLKGKSLAGARVLSLAVIVALTTVPILAQLILFSDFDTDSPARTIWIFTPLFDALLEIGDINNAPRLFFWGSVMLILGAILGMLSAKREE